MKKCPFCAEEIQDAAVVCKHCGKDVGPGAALKSTGEKMQSIGCALTLLVTLPILVVMLLAGAC